MAYQRTIFVAALREGA